ncbi:MAG TPA: hypothetical protein VK308_11805 [Pyrinomonadaceae bacterium]|nr:hypothetical protein [Pyrinomonadaceae bacterium]
MKLLAFIFLVAVFVAVPAFGQSDFESLKQSVQTLEYLKKYDEAIVKASKAIEIQPDDIHLYLTRARLQRHVKNNEAVLKDVWKAVLLAPKNDSALEYAAKQLLLTGQFEENIKLADYLIASGSVFIGYRIRYQNKFQLKDYVGTIEDIIKIRDVAEAYSEGLLSKVLYELKDEPNIETYFETLFKFMEERRKGPSTMGSMMMLYRDRVTLYTDYATFYEERRTPAETNALFDKYAKDLGLETRSEIYKKLGKYDAAISDLTKVLESTQYKDTYLMKRGDVYVLTQRFDQAIADYKAAKEISDEESFQQNANEKIAEAKLKKIENNGQLK